jgi:hypothetical protein
MRFFSIILLCYISLLAVLPTICQSYTLVSKIDLCCINTKGDCKSNSENNNPQPQKSSDNNCCIPCGASQVCHCYFIVTSQLNFSIVINETLNKWHSYNESAISNSPSNCWHPPKFV